MPLPYVVFGKAPPRTMPEYAEQWTNDNSPIPVLRRAPVLLDSHIRESGDKIPPRQADTDSNLRRSISHRISRATTTTLGRSLTESLRRPSGTSHSSLQGGQVMYRNDVRIRKAHANSLPLSAFRPNPRGSTTFTFANDGPRRFAHAHDLPMHTDAVDQQDGKSSVAEVPVPALLQQGVAMTKVSAKSQKSYLFRLDADQGQIIWESKKLRISRCIFGRECVDSRSPGCLPRPPVPIENIKELRSGSDARYYRQQFQLAREYEDRWITIIYMLDGQYKTLHLIASSLDSFQLWDITLRKLYAIRQELMTSLGNEEIRHAVWIKQCWKSAGEDHDHQLSFEQVEKLCRRLNINSSQEDLMRLFRVG